MCAGIWSCNPQGGNNTDKDGVDSAAVIRNPVLPGDRPDPTVIKIGDTYWASATSNEWAPLFPVFKSTDLQNWELVSYVFPEGAPSWARNNFWAPELAYDSVQNKVYMYYTARDKASNRLSVAVASADRPEGPYTDHGPLVAQEYGSIDAFEMRNTDGKLYLFWKEDGNSKRQPTPMWAQEINEERTQLLGEKTEIFRNDQPWEAQLVEGIAIFRKNDYFYATYSAGACCDVKCNYKAGVARAKDLLGPWEKYAGNPVLEDNAHWKCAGHGTVVENQGEHYLLYHAYSRNGSVYVGREGVLEKINWSDDGWPVFANNAVYSRTSETIDFTDDFTQLKPVWQWRVTQQIAYKTGSDGLFLHASTDNQGIGTLLVQPTVSPDYEVSARIGIEKSNAETGIALVGAAHNGFGAPLAAIGVTADKKNIIVWKTADGKREVLAQEPYSPGSAEITLRMRVSGGKNITFSAEGQDKEAVGLGDYDAEPLVPWGMGFRIGMVAHGDAAHTANFRHLTIKNNQL